MGELAHEEAGVTATYLLISQPAFASKLAPTRACVPTGACGTITSTTVRRSSGSRPAATRRAVAQQTGCSTQLLL
ncbi:hypothetical protein CU668_12270 [Pseudomonas syringae pv. actinidifoliorum]|nr:hypothetical protein [Pseudomonas syringae pv. actinidifoliorum]